MGGSKTPLHPSIIFYESMSSSVPDWKSVNHSKHLLLYHLIIVCRYRRKLLADNSIPSDIKSPSNEICERHGVNIKHMGTDKDRIHCTIETDPTVRLLNLVRTPKSFTACHIRGKYPAYLSKCFWNERSFRAGGCFICSVGNVSEARLKEYIENQGRSWSTRSHTGSC